ncbi:MAG: helix-turn-helix domain-containing protein, partial [Bacteroidota bacterium]
MPRSKNFDRQEVLQKAVELFWQKGFHATSMQDLVDHLEINRGSMYNTFGGKEQLFQEALALYKKQTGQDSKDILSSGDGS